jgi:hypothetical protein
MALEKNITVRQWLGVEDCCAGTGSARVQARLRLETP